MALSQAKLLFHEILFGLFAFFLVDTDIQNKGGGRHLRTPYIINQTEELVWQSLTNFDGG